MADDVDTEPATIIFVASNLRMVVDDDYEMVLSRINVVSSDLNPVIRVTPQGNEEVAILLKETIIVLPGDRRTDFHLVKPSTSL